MVDTFKLAVVSKVKREIVKENIIKGNPVLEELYEDYQHIKDIYSLDKISNNIQTSLSVDGTKKDGQIVIIRVLQVIGELMKNTLESPNLSDRTSGMLLLSLPADTRKVITSLRDALSHAKSLSKRMELEENFHFFGRVQNDLKTIYQTTIDILLNYKIDSVRKILKRISERKNENDVKEIVDILNKYVGVNTSKENLGNLGTTKHEKIKKLIENFIDIIREKINEYEKDIIHDIYEKLKAAETENKTINYMTAFGYVRMLYTLDIESQMKCSTLNFNADRILKAITSEFKSKTAQDIITIITEIFHSVNFRIKKEQKDELEQIIDKIIYICELEIDDIKWIKQLRERLNLKSIDKNNNDQIESTSTQANTNTINKLNQLKEFLYVNELNLQPLPHPLMLHNKLNLATEMFVLDILEGSENNLEKNYFYLDDCSPSLIGRNLRNHLAHNNPLIELLISNPARNTLINAQKLVTSETTIRKTIQEDINKLKCRYNRCIAQLNVQNQMFRALEEGDLNKLKATLHLGADIHGKNIDSWSALHFAAKGPNLDVVKFVISQNIRTDSVDSTFRNPLHIAAAFDKASTVEYLVVVAGLPVDILDNVKRTPLHHAARQGNARTVTTLLKLEADVHKCDCYSAMPIVYAIRNCNIEVVNILLKYNNNIPVGNGLTFLHLAVEAGSSELVNTLLKRGADMNARTETGLLPVHIAALNGRLNILNCLISNGADVNARDNNGNTPLHAAAEGGHATVVKELIKQGALVNLADKTNHFTPLHSAAMYGHLEVVQVLLRYKANVNAVLVNGVTPLLLTSQHGHYEILSVLLQHGANINVMDKDKAGPLIHAIATNHIDVAKLLMENRADVNTPNIQGYTPLHVAAKNGYVDIIDLLIERKAETNAKHNFGSTPLHAAAEAGRADAVVCLLKHKANINATNSKEKTPLHCAICSNNIETIRSLILYQDDTNFIKKNSESLLGFAFKAGSKEVIDILMTNGACFDACEDPLSLLILLTLRNNTEIVENLFLKWPNVNIDYNTWLMLAVDAGYPDIVEVLLKHKVNLEITDPRLGVPVHLAAFRGHTETLKLFLEYGANMHNKIQGQTPLHLAAAEGHSSTVQMLLEKGIRIESKNSEHRTAIELAVASGHLKVVKTLVQFSHEVVHTTDNNGKNLLHLAAGRGDVEIVKFLIDEGCNMQPKCDLWPIHMAVEGGHTGVVEVLVNNGCLVHVLDLRNRTLLHMAVSRNYLDLAVYLIEQGIDVDAQDIDGSSALHVAARLGLKHIITELLKRGAAYNLMDNHNRKAVETAADATVITILDSTEKLFNAVKTNNVLEVKAIIQRGAYINAKNAADASAMHIAAREGYVEVAKTLLLNKANPNIPGKNGFSPLHYAANFSHYNVLEVILSYGGVYNATSDNGKAPFDVARNKNIKWLLKLISDAFELVRRNNATVLGILNQIKPKNTLKAVMRARNRDYKTLILFAIQENFGQVEQLKYISQKDETLVIRQATLLLSQDKLDEALNILNSLLVNGEDIFEPDSLVEIDIWVYVAEILCKKEEYKEAFNILEKLFKKQIEILGFHHSSTTMTQWNMVVILQKQGKYKKALNVYQNLFKKQKENLDFGRQDWLSLHMEMAKMLYNEENYQDALDIYQEIFEKQKDILGPNHVITLKIQFLVSLQLLNLGKLKEALNTQQQVFEKRKEILGLNHLGTLMAHIFLKDIMAEILKSENKTDEALEMVHNTYKIKEKILGSEHINTIQTLNQLAKLLYKDEKYQEALEIFQKVVIIQTKVLGQLDSFTLKTKYNIAIILFLQKKRIEAFKAFNECIHKMKAVFGSNDSMVLDVLDKLEDIKCSSQIICNASFDSFLQDLQSDIIRSTIKGDTNEVKKLLKTRANVNDIDADGRTALHYSITNNCEHIVTMLLQHGADVTVASYKGNTPLHTAVVKGNNAMIEMLLQQVSQEQVNDFINSRTFCGGMTALHIASSKGFLDAMKILLKHGAAYNIKNTEDKTPVELTKNQELLTFLNLVEQLFKFAKNGNDETINLLSKLKPFELKCVMNARNNKTKTLLQIASIKHKDLANKLLKLLKNVDEV